MSFPKICIIHPSRGRAREARKVYDNLFHTKYLHSTDIEYRLSLDLSDPSLNSYLYEFSGKRVFITLNGTNSAISATNKAAYDNIYADIFIVVSDDVEFTANWDYQILEETKEAVDFCLKIETGNQNFIMEIPVMDNIFFKNQGYIYNPIYPHLYADTELSAVAWMTGRYIKSNVKATHNHWTIGKREKDELDEKNYTNLQGQKQLFKQRLKENFGLTDFIPLPEKSGLEKYRI